MKAIALVVSLCAASASLPETAFAQKRQILVSAAASLTDALLELQRPAEGYLGARVQFNFGGSGALRRQIEEGAPVDVFFAASGDEMDRLETEGLVDASTRRNLLSNRIVLIGAAGEPPVSAAAQLRAILSRTRLLAIGNPDLVPAGRYALKALAALGLSPVVEGKLVLGGTVREVLQYVESGSAPLGIVFATDALLLRPDGAARVLFRFPADAVGVPIVYPVAVVSASRERNMAERMIQFLQGAAARDAFRRAGFILE